MLDLWNNEYPINLSFINLTDFDNYLNTLANPRHLLIMNSKSLLLGWAFSFDREHERWFAIIVSEKLKGKGYGSKLLETLKNEEKVLNAWVIDHNNYKKSNNNQYISPIMFYLKNEFEIIHETRLELDKLSAVKIKWKS